MGQTLGVIAEHVKPRGVLYGIADNYINVRLPLDYSGRREIRYLKITSASPGYVVGE